MCEVCDDWVKKKLWHWSDKNFLSTKSWVEKKITELRNSLTILCKVFEKQHKLNNEIKNYSACKKYLKATKSVTVKKIV